jgi:hypothetical protein
MPFLFFLRRGFSKKSILLTLRVYNYFSFFLRAVLDFRIFGLAMAGSLSKLKDFAFLFLSFMGCSWIISNLSVLRFLVEVNFTLCVFLFPFDFDFLDRED